jgi:hypothetical protein
MSASLFDTFFPAADSGSGNDSYALPSGTTDNTAATGTSGSSPIWGFLGSVLKTAGSVFSSTQNAQNNLDAQRQANQIKSQTTVSIMPYLAIGGVLVLGVVLLLLRRR